MYNHVMVETIQRRLLLFRGGGGGGGGGGKVYNVMLHFNAATLRELISYILCLI